MKTTKYGIVVINLKDHTRTRKHTYRVCKRLETAMKHYTHIKGIVDKRIANGEKLTIKIKNLANNKIVFAE